MPGMLLAVVVLLNGSSIPAQYTKPIPPEFEGVWQITTVILKNGEKRPLFNDAGQQMENVFPYVELIVVADRMVFVKATGQSTWCRAEMVAAEPDVKIRMLAGTHDDKVQKPEYGLMRLSGTELTFKCLPADMVSLDGDTPVAIVARR